jgi:hypothetical protein
MAGEPAGTGTTRATSRPGARTARRGSVSPGSAGNPTSAARPRGNSTGQRAAPAPPEGLSEPFEPDADAAAGDLSEPFETVSSPPKIAPPKEGTPTLARSRFVFALCSVALLAFVVVASFVTLWRGQRADDLTRLLEIMFAPLVAVVAAAVAFYCRGPSQ